MDEPKVNSVNGYIKNKINSWNFSKKQLLEFMLITGSAIFMWTPIQVKDVLYEPFRAHLGITNTQFGLLFSINGFVQIFGYLLLGWILDNVNVKKVIAFDMTIYAAIGMFLAFSKNLPFPLLLVIFAVFGLFGDALYWPLIQKATKHIGGRNNQGKAFSLQGLFRALGGALINSLSVLIFTTIGGVYFGIGVAMMVNCIMSISFAIFLYIKMPNDFLKDDEIIEESENEVNDKSSIKKVLIVLKYPVVWLTGLGSACIYVVGIGVYTYYLPFLQHIYSVPVSVVGMIGSISGLLGMVIGPISGIVSDKFFKNSASWMSICYLILIGTILGVMVMPKGNSFVMYGVVGLVSSMIGVILVKSIYYSPLGEYGIDDNISATAMSVASFIGYSPNFFAYPLIGSILDSYATGKAYRIIFIVFLISGILGFIINLINSYQIKKHIKKQANA
ncbi:MFS transporter [Lactobacillus sp. YT155]|uniref:MFS transporter n=1 Tax=Lactobacillus sp. YT155 TaxID=3060955 RepID=UPI00265F979B|nr:MFS transporter [Lactobacillus sp. YT155]MDO1605852.1 MFS transporter [Lactobacillus sp. YT155]